MKSKIFVAAIIVALVSCKKEKITILAEKNVHAETAKAEKTAKLDAIFLNSWLYKSEGSKIVRLKVSNNGGKVKFVKAEMYCEDVRFQYSPSWGKPVNNNTIAATLDFKAAGTDNKGDDYIDVILPIEKGELNGAWLQATFAMLDEKGNQIGKALNFSEEVAVEDNDKKEDSEVESVKFVSYDKGKTWNLSISIDQFGGPIDSVEFEFDNESNYFRTGGGGKVTKIVVSSGGLDYNVYRRDFTIKGLVFEKDPTGQTLTGKVFGFGTGTRTSATQASTKAELL